MKKFTAIWLIVFAFLCLVVANNGDATSGPKRCGNAECSVPISRAKTLVRYSSPMEDRISFAKGMEVDVYIKRKDAWGVKVGNKIGFAPASFLKEMKLFVSSKDLVTVPETTKSEAPSVKVETSVNDSVDLPMEKTAEIPAAIGSLLSFPSMAAAQSVEGQQDNIPTPSSPQYEVVDGTTIWMDPLPPMQNGQPPLPYPSEKTGVEQPAAENVPESLPEILQNVTPTSESSSETLSEASFVPTPDAAQNIQEVTEPPSAEVPPTPIPIDSSVTPPALDDNNLDTPQEYSTETSTETSTEALLEASQEAATEASPETATEASPETATEASPETATEASPETAPEASSQAATEVSLEAATEASSEGSTEEATTEQSSEAENGISEETTESPDIQPTQAGIMSNLWNTMFNSGDGTEENSQENDEDGEEGEEDEDGEDDGEGDEDEESSTEEGSIQGTAVTSGSDAPVDAVEYSSAAPPSAEDIAQNVVVENIPQSSTAAPEELATSFPQTLDENLDDKIRSARQVETFSEEVTSTESTVVEGEVQASGEQMGGGQPADRMEQNQVTGNDAGAAQNEALTLQQLEEEQLKLEEKAEQERKQAEEEQKRLEEEELKQQQEQAKKQQEELQRMQEEEQKRLQEEEQKRLQEEEALRLVKEEELKQKMEEQKRQEDEMRQKEEEVKRLQEEETKRVQEEEAKRLQEEEMQRLQEEEVRRQQEAERLRVIEEENQKSLAAENSLWLQNQQKQRIREEEMRKQRDEAKQRQVQEILEREREKNKMIEEAALNATEEKQIENQPEQVPSNAEEEASSGGMFSWFSGLFGSNDESSGSESEVKIDEPQPKEAQPQIEVPSSSPPSHQHGHPPVWSSEQQTMCSASEEGCGMKAEEELEASSLFMGIQTPSLDVILLRLAATAVALLMGALSFYFLRKKNVDSSLVAKINELEKQLLVASKEAVILREEATTLDASVNAEELNALREELESSRIVRADLEEQVSTLERELEEATETGIELNKLLSETLEASKGKAHAGLAASVERLQQQLDSQRDKVDSLTRSLKSTSAENENLKSVAAESKEKISALEAELAAAADIAINIRREKEEANVLVAQELQQVQSRLEEALSSKVLEESRLGSELSALKLKHETLRSALSMRDAEVKALQDTLKELESGETDQLLDVTKVKAEIEHTKKERDAFLVKYEEEEKARKDIEERLNKITETLKNLEEKVDIAERGKEEAETRLTVLSNYFKEKEEQLQKELGLKEAIVAQHRGDESTVIKHLQSLQDEVSTLRAQNESLTKEILDQERDFKGQMATLEKKAHDNWMTARQAERRLEDARQEAAQLRNRLTHVEKSNADPNNRLDANGEGGVASPVMMMPLPPLGDMETPPPLPPFMFSPPPYPPPFMPPPLPPHPMGRPPPLGRMSSPPPPLGQFSPPPPPYDRLDRSSRSRSPSPPPHRYHHRSPPPPQPWDAPPSSFRPVPKPSPKKPSEHREHKGSMHSSGHSNESADKSREHV